MKRFLLILILFAACPAFAEYSYVSPETYAVNEADLLDYMSIPRSVKPNIDELDNKRKINKNIEKSYKPAKEKKVKTITREEIPHTNIPNKTPQNPQRKTNRKGEKL